MSACQKKWWAPFQLGCETAEVVYMCSSLLQLVPGSCDLSRAEKRITVYVKLNKFECQMKVYVPINRPSKFHQLPFDHGVQIVFLYITDVTHS